MSRSTWNSRGRDGCEAVVRPSASGEQSWNCSPPVVPPVDSVTADQLKELLLSLNAGEQLYCAPDLDVATHPACEFGFAAEHVSCYLKAELLCDKVPGAGPNRVGHLNSAIPEALEKLIQHCHGHLEILTADSVVTLDVECITRQHVAVLGDIGAECASEFLFSRGQRVTHLDDHRPEASPQGSGARDP